MDVIIQACRGIAYMMGESGERPRFVSFAVTDILGALNAFGAICASLYRRSVTGEGEYIDIALADCAVAVLGNQVETHIFSGGKEEFRYMAGSFSGAVAPAGAFKGRDADPTHAQLSAVAIERAVPEVQYVYYIVDSQQAATNALIAESVTAQERLSA